MMIKGYSPKTGAMLAIDKPVDWTSFDVVNKIRRITGIKKVGHAGTLDPFATGVLVICLGPATKQSGELMNLPKEYIAEIELGRETDTMDVTGKTILEKEVPELTQSSIEATFEALTGEVEQEVPAYSAAKIKGKRMYKLAREGKEMPQVFKKVTIEAIDLLDFSEKTIRIRVLCGRGTYIRTLGRDIARALNTAGFLKTLVRTRVGDFLIENAQSIEEFQEQLAKSTEIVSD
ncbi:MAG: tRNA pseudouridine(55) synthase TruB [Calditrichaeota bacterium]|nr:tRNA pseudouridine(55) synthase TruB [Calditrichota bacterium]MCB0267847.1 tRNA pseudouridine(55) synthase TruB [Calditrichota bacterium]MCB0286638.1 tRNA pseudouridine(55) synthase TruB [Calditrichota bacterium]